jgi:PAS domain S-box-containing protein
MLYNAGIAYAGMNKKTLFIIFTIGMVCVIIVGGLGASQYVKTKLTQNLTNQYADHEGQLARQVAQTLELEVSGIEAQLKIMAQFSEIKNGTPQQCIAKLTDIYKLGQTNIGNIARVNKNGFFDCSLNKALLGVKASNLGPYIVQIFNDPNHTPVMSKAIAVPGISSLAIGIHVPIYDASQRFVGTLGGAMYLKDLQQKYLTDIDFAPGGTINMADEDGTILYNTNTDLIGKNIASPEFQKPLTGAISSQQSIEGIKNGNAIIKQFLFNGKPTVAVAVPVNIFENRKWRIALWVPIATIQDNLRQLGAEQLINELGFAMLSIVILTSVMFLWIMIRKIFNPISIVTSTAEKISQGDLSARVLIEDGDEVGRLGKAFNLMTEKLQNSYDKLDEKVKERTFQLEEAKAKDDAILASIGEGVAVADVQGKIIYWNAAAEQILGTPIDAILEKELEKKYGIFYEDEKTPMPREKQALSRALKGERIDGLIEFIKMPLVPKGRHIIVTAQPIYLKDQTFLGAVAVFRDISHEKQIDRAKTEFVSLASHQLRTPITAIKWYTEMLLDPESPKLKKDQKEYVEIISDSNRRMVDLVNSLLNVSRIELGTFSVDTEIVHVVEICKSIVSELKPLIEKKSLTIVEEYAEHIPQILADEKLLRIIFQNLISNACKYSNDLGTVTIQITNNKKQLIVSIQDTGIGIPLDQQSKIFTKLFRANNAAHLETDGTGLGLYIIKSIIESTGGSISFKSVENKGSTFEFKIPLTGMKNKTGDSSLQ